MYRKWPCLFVLFLQLFSTGLSAEELTLYTENGPPLNYKDKNGDMRGFVIEIIQEIQKRLNSNYKINMIPWVRAYKYVIDPNSSNMALFSMTFTEERRNLFKWVGPVAQASWQFYAKADSTVVINNLDDARKVKAIGTYRKDVREVFLQTRGFTNLQSTAKSAQNIHKLLHGRITLWFTSNISSIGTAITEKINFRRIKPVYTFKPKGLYIAFHKNTSNAVVERWQQAYDEMKKDGTLKSIFQKWNLMVPTYVIPPP